MSLDDQNGFRSYRHVRWTPDEGAPTQLTSVTQDPRGFLWVSGENGVFRLDGTSFDTIPSPPVPGAPFGKPREALALRSGDVWVFYLQSRRFAYYRGGMMHLLPQMEVL
ncbi:hypothetical protein [Sphingomonas sp. NFR15]|uniref:hypothetical protein n=1 Tax=Sphingomonas sp. NFR15 TaxID=1566282 RepID=UPI0008899333|nr:hypothetical protein [Sphingomonas sp. NFR15]SDA35902.1 hypothetical protein SAMN03159340_03436 [Sphingomonas sp. NFR15]